MKFPFGTGSNETFLFSLGEQPEMRNLFRHAMLKTQAFLLPSNVEVAISFSVQVNQRKLDLVHY